MFDFVANDWHPVEEKTSSALRIVRHASGVAMVLFFLSSASIVVVPFAIVYPVMMVSIILWVVFGAIARRLQKP